MPNTLIREGYLDSDKVSALADFDDRVFFRILIAADDAGRTDGRADKLRSVLFPTRENVRGADIEKSVSRLIQAGLLSRWAWDGKPVVQVMRWQRRSGAQFSKYPDSAGVFKISWTEVETRDGKHAFSSTSLPMGCASVQQPIDNPFDPLSGKPTYTNTNTKTETYTDTENTLPADKPPKPSGKKPERKCTDEQVATHQALCDWWSSEAYPRQHHGVVYQEFDSGDAAAGWKILRSKSVQWDLGRAKAIAEYFLSLPEGFGNQGHRLRQLGSALAIHIGKFEEKQKGFGNGNNYQRPGKPANRIAEEIRV